MNIHAFARIALGGALLAEGSMALRRFEARRHAFEAAARRAATLGRPLIVVGDPDAGAHTRLARAYGCGDRCIDLHGCPRCRVMQAADLTAGPVPGVEDDSAVVFVSCVLEYVTDADAALQELRRMAGTHDNLFIVFVERWTFTASLYPGARWTGGREGDDIALSPVSTARKLATVGGLLGLFALAIGSARS